MLSIALTSVFAIDFNEQSIETSSTQGLPSFFAEAGPSGVHHEIVMQAVKMPDGMYAYQMLEYTIGSKDLVIHKDNPVPSNGVYTTKPQIPGPTLVFTEGDSVDLTLWNYACDDFVIGDTGFLPTENENSLVGIHVHGVHYDITDDASYNRMNMNGNSAASCNSSVNYDWEVGLGTQGTWPYHDHTFYQNEVGAEDIGLFGTVIVNPYDNMIQGLVNGTTGSIDPVPVDEINKEFVLWMVSSEVLGRSVFYGMEIDNHHPTNPGKQTPLWINPPLYAEENTNVRYHVIGLGDETHAFHLHGHRWVDATGGSADIIDVKEITPLQRHTFLVTASDNGENNDADDPEGWMYHCHVFEHMQAGMSGMMMVVDDDTLPDVGAVFTLSDEPGLWMKTLNAGVGDDLDEVLESVGALSESDTKAGIGFPLNYLGKALGSGFADSQGRSLAVIQPGETVLFNMKDSQTKHTITALIYPTNATDDSLGDDPVDNTPGGNGILSLVDIGFFDTQVGIRGSSFITDGNAEPVGLDDPGLYVFVCKIHPYMFSAVIVDNPETKVYSEALGAHLPLLDFSESLTVLTRSGTLGTSQFPTVIPPTDPLASELLTDFFVITDPSNWKDYEKSHFTVSVPPVLVTTNTNDLAVGLHADKAETLALAGALGIKKADMSDFALSEVAGLNLDINMTIPTTYEPEIPGVGEVWVNTQFERTVNKNHPGTPQDKPGTITVVDTNDWTVKKKISLPEINMNHPHNMWTDTENEVIYQTQWFDSRMVAIDRDSGEMIKDTFVGQSPSHVMTAPDTGKIYIAMNGEEQVVEMDPTTYEITKQISTGFRSHPHGHWISSDGNYMVTPDFIGLSSSIINLDDNTIAKAYHPGGDPLGTGFDFLLLGPIATGMMGSGEKYYTADFLGNTLSVIDPTTAEIIKQIDLNGNGTGLPIQTPVSPDDKWVVTANVIAAKITVVDTDTDKVVKVLPCDPGCHGVQWGAKNHEEGGYYAYVSNKFSNALIVVDPDPDYDGNADDAYVAGKIVLVDDDEIDDPVIGYAGMGGQGVLAIPNVYDGWIERTVLEVGMKDCDIPKGPKSQGKGDAQGKGPCDEIRNYLFELTSSQRNPIP
jgi:DNA-binding beta-propeller fold protein YncE/plastocyanin